MKDLPGLAVIVIAEAGSSGEVEALAQAGFPVVTIGLAGIAPGERLSTLGEPGARHDQAGFLAGIVVGLSTRTGWVGLIEGTGGFQEVVYQNAFIHGLRYICPACRLVSLLVADANADAFRAKGVDVVFGLPGPELNRLLGNLIDTGIWMVLVGDNQAPIPVAQVAGRVVFEPERALAPALDALLAGESGASWPASLELNTLRLVDVNPEAITPGRERLLLEAAEAIRSGELSIGIDPETGERP